jgi:hypothetical protein
VKIDTASADLGVEIIIRHKCCPTSEKLRELVAHLFEERECIPPQGVAERTKQLRE